MKSGRWTGYSVGCKDKQEILYKTGTSWYFGGDVSFWLYIKLFSAFHVNTIFERAQNLCNCAHEECETMIRGWQEEGGGKFESNMNS